MPDFFNTRAGQRFASQLNQNLKRVAEELEKQNQLKEKELEIRERKLKE